MRLMAMPAMRLSLAETRGAPKRLHDEGRFAKPAVLEESPAREVAVWLAQVSREECGTLGGVIHLALRAWLAQSRLPVALPANRDVLARAGVVEIHGRLDDALIGSLSRGHGEHMIPRRAVAHFAVDSALCKFE